MLSPRNSLCALAASLCAPLTAQDIVRIWHGQAGDGFGAAIAAVGDTNLDGRVDVAVGAPERAAGIGAVDVFSCGTGALLRTLSGNAPGDRFGQVVEAAGDLDRDGRHDLWVLAATRLHAFSGRDGSLLWQYERPAHFAPMPDFDGDGHADLALVDRAREIQVRSGSDGGVLARLALTDLPITRFAVAGDVDRDGDPDVMTTRFDPSTSRNVVDVWDLDTGRSLFTVSSPGFAPGFGEQIGSAGDVDRDGHADFFIHDSQPVEPPIASDNGISVVYSGATFTELVRDRGYIFSDRGTYVRVLRQRGYSAGPDDVDGEGVAERFARFELWGAAQVEVRRNGATVLRLPGAAVEPAGDADRDGIGDYLLAGNGEVWLVTAGRTARQPHRPVNFAERSYGAVAQADVDRDGYADYSVSYAFPGNLARQPFSVVTIHSGSDGGVLWSFTRDPTIGMLNLVLAVGGDVDRDGRTDIGVTGYGDREIRVYGSVQATTPALVITDTSATTALALGADWTGDGISDVFAASPVAIELRSGATGAVVATLPFGAQELRLVGDVDGDEIGDLFADVGNVAYARNADVVLDARIIGSMSRSVVRLLPSLPVGFVPDQDGDGRADYWRVSGDSLVLASGFDGNEIRRLPAPSGGVIASLAAGSDWNRDGWLDLLAGQPTWAGFGRAAVVSGLDGRLLHTELGEAAGDMFGAQVGLLPFDPARFDAPALVATATQGALSNTGYGRWAQPRAFPAAVRMHGIACSHGDVRPQLQWDGGVPRLGASYSLHTVGLLGGTLTVFLFGTRDDAFGGLALPAHLSTAGMPGCVLHVAAEVQVPTSASASGRASIVVAVPAVPALLGARLFSQSLVREPSANQLGLLASDGSRIIIGR